MRRLVEKDVMGAVKKMKDGKTTGSDSIAVKILKNGR